jgi:hypothetical protein
MCDRVSVPLPLRVYSSECLEGDSPKFSHHEGAYRPEPQSSGAPAKGGAALLGLGLLGRAGHVLDGDATS